MRKERIIWSSIIVLLVTLLVLTFNHPFSKADENDENLYFDLFQKTYYQLKNSYIEKKEPKDLMIAAIQGMIKSLDDPHTAFLIPTQKQDLEIETSGEYGGLGIEIGVRDNKLTVISPMEDTPAERLGIRAGDRIVKIEGKPVENPDVNEVVKVLRGKPGTDVTITIERDNFNELLDFKITREVIKMKSVKYDTITNIGYIRLISFRKNAPEELKNALLELNKKNIKGLIIDLRNNPGGLLDVAVDVCDLFIKKGIIVSIKPREDALMLNNLLKKDFYATGQAIIDKNEPIVILVNHGSASASEIFAGALKDHKRGVLIGNTTFGKGSVQSVINLDDGYGLRFTTAYYYTPSGAKIHKIGIDPDISIDLPQPNQDEVKLIKRIFDEKLVESFVNKNKTPSDSDLDTFMNELKTKNIILDKILIKRLVRQELYKNRKEPLYDLDYDTQLKMALQIINAELIFRR